METRGSLPFNPTNRRLQSVVFGESLGGTWHVGYVEQLFELSGMLNAGKYSAVHRRCFVGALRGEVLVDVSRWSQIMEGV